MYTGAAEAIKKLLVERSATPSSPAGAATRPPTPRSSSGRSATPSAAVGRSSSTASTPAQLGGKAVEILPQGYHNCVATLQYRDGGFHLDSIDANRLRDRWGTIHARPLSPTFYDPQRFQPSPKGVEYLQEHLHQRPGGRRRRVDPLDF